MQSKTPLISIIMRSYNDETRIAHTLASLSAQTVQDYELWNHDSSSKDGTVQQILYYNEARNIILNDSRSYNPGSVLNNALHYCRGQYIVFLNSDATPVDKYWLENLISPLKDPKVAAVFGRQVPHAGCRSLFVRDTERAFGDGCIASNWVHFFSLANSATRRSVVDQFLFKTTVQYSEDIEWSLRLKRSDLSIHYAADAVVAHSHNYSLQESYKRHFGEGKAEATIFRQKELNFSFTRYTLLPFVMEVVRDIAWALRRLSPDAALHCIPLRFAQKWGRWQGLQQGLKQGPRLHCQE